MHCNNKNCPSDATIQFDHYGELISYCKKCWVRYGTIMNAMGSPIPISYLIGVCND